jgi:hypothetical protein
MQGTFQSYRYMMALIAEQAAEPVWLASMAKRYFSSRNRACLGAYSGEGRNVRLAGYHTVILTRCETARTRRGGFGDRRAALGRSPMGSVRRRRQGEEK